MATYQRSSQHTGLWLLICGLGIAAQVLVLYVLHITGLEKKMQGWILVVAVVPFGIAVIFGLWLISKLDGKRKNALELDLRALGFEASLKPTSEMKNSFCQSMERLMRCMGMVRGPEQVQWLALRGEEGSRMAAWEYMFTTGSGKTTQVHDFTAVAWPSTHPETSAEIAQMPMCEFYHPFLLQRMGRRKEEIEVEGLPKEWAAYGDAATAQRLMTPAVLAVMEDNQRGEAFFVGEGWVAMVYRGKFDGKNFRLFWWRANQWLGALREAVPAVV